MVAARVGSVNRGGAAGTSLATTYPQVPTAENLLLCALAATRGNATPATPSIAATGWTLLGWATGVRGAISNILYLWGKWAVGGDTAPTIAQSTATTTTWTMEEWEGLEPGVWPEGIPISWPSLVNSHITNVITTNIDRTADSDEELAFVIWGGRTGSSGDMLSAWDADLTASSPTTGSGRTASVYTAYDTIPTADTTMNYTGSAKATSDGGAMSGIGVVGFALLGDEPPPPEAVVPSAVDEGGILRPIITEGVVDAGGVLRPITQYGIVDAGGVLRPLV